MLIDPKKLSAIIREKKKKLAHADPELVDVDYKPDMNPMDMYNVTQQARIEETIHSPHKINAEEADMAKDAGAGLSAEEKKRMGRLRAYFDTLDIA